MSDLTASGQVDERRLLEGVVERARANVAKADKQISEIQAARARDVEKLEHAERLLQLIREDAPHLLEPVQVAAAQKKQEALPGLQPDQEEPDSWVDAVRNWIYAAPRGVTFGEMREIIEESPEFAARFRSSQKGYYNALSRLRGREEIVKYNGRHFSPKAYQDYRRAVADGIVEDEAPLPNAYSPMGEAILDIVAASNGILGKDILRTLRTDPEFNATLTPHNSGAYNIIARLARREQIIRRDDGLCFPGPKFPKRDPSSKWLRGAA